MVTQVQTAATGTVRWTSGLNAVLGIWLILAPFILGYSTLTPAVWNDIVVGILIVALAGTRVSKPTRYEAASWTNAGIGAWLIAAPFILPYSEAPALVANVQAAFWNDIIVGLIVLVLAVASAMASRRATTKV